MMVLHPTLVIDESQVRQAGYLRLFDVGLRLRLFALEEFPVV